MEKFFINRKWGKKGVFARVNWFHGNLGFLSLTIRKIVHFFFSNFNESSFFTKIHDFSIYFTLLETLVSACRNSFWDWIKL